MTFLSIGDVRKQVKEIERGAKVEPTDYEWLHGLQDALYEAVLTAIVDDHPDPKNLAKTALKAKKIAFRRYTA